MKKVIIPILIIAFLIPLLGSTNPDSVWRDDPRNCPTEYMAQNCTGNNVLCGYSGGIVYCYDKTSLYDNPPSSSANSDTSHSGDYDGGYIVDCEAYNGGEPYCDNGGGYWCDRNSNCYSTQHRITTCTANTWATYTCGACHSGYHDCDTGGDTCEIHDGSACGVSNHGTYYGCDGASGNCTCRDDAGSQSSYWDCDSSGSNSGNGCEILYHGGCGTNAWYTGCAGSSGQCSCKSTYYYCDGAPDDGDGCEVHHGGSCTIGELPGTWSCSASAGGCYTVSGGTEYTCTCIVDKSYFETGTKAEYSTEAEDSFLWGWDYGSGNLLSLTATPDLSFIVDSGAAISSCKGITSSGTIILSGLTNCDTIDTDGSGVLSCGTDDTGGDVTGPGSATDNAVARFDLTTGKIIQNSVVTIADTTGNMAGVGTLGCGAITSTGQAMFGSVDEVVGSEQNLIYGTIDSTSEGNLLLLQNETADKFKVDKDGNVTLNSFILEGGTYDTTLRAGTSTASVVYTWPLASGSAGDVLTDAAGDGVLSWAAGGGGGYWSQSDSYLYPANTGWNVGIGTATPSSKLTVKGSASGTLTGTVNVTDQSVTITCSDSSCLFTTEVGLGDRVLINSETKTITEIASATSMTASSVFTANASGQTVTRYPTQFKIEGSDGDVDLVIQDNGSVGIGTTEPGENLVVEGAVQSQTDDVLLRLQRWRNDNFYYPASVDFAVLAFNAGGPATQLDIRLRTTKDNGAVADKTVMTLLNTGNVGIGMTEPNGRLAIGGNITWSEPHARGLNIGPTFDGSGDGPGGIGAQPTFTPSGNIGWAYGMLNIANANPPVGVTISNLVGGYYRVDSVAESAGSITNSYAMYSGPATYFSGAKPGNQYGIYIANQGLSGITNAYGLYVAAQTGAASNYSAIFNGKVGIGVTEPGEPLEVVGRVFIGDGGGATKKGLLIVGTEDPIRLCPYDYGASYMNLNIAANMVGIRRTPLANMLEVQGDASKTTAGDWDSNSDFRIKTNIQDIDNAVETIMKLHPVKFKYTDEYKQLHPVEDKYYYNFIAQEYQKVFPGSVKGSGEFLKDDDEEILQMGTHSALIVAIKAIQELKKENELLKQLICLDHPEAEICR